MHIRSGIVPKDQSTFAKKIMALATGNPIMEDASPIARKIPGGAKDKLAIKAKRKQELKKERSAK